MNADAERMVPAEHFVQFLVVNVDNEMLSDAEFRHMVRRTLPIVVGAEKKAEESGQ